MGINAPLNRKLRMGLVGGGQGAFIGKVHSHRRLSRQSRRPRRRRTVFRPGQGQGVGSRLRHSRQSGLRFVPGNDRQPSGNCPPTNASISSRSLLPITRTSRLPRRSPRRASTSSVTSR